MNFSLLSNLCLPFAFAFPLPSPSHPLFSLFSPGVNGFGRIGRLVTRIMMDDPECDLKAINAGSATADYMAYQFKYDTIHGKYAGSVETEGDFLIINGQKIPTSRARDPKEANWGTLGANGVHLL